MKTVVIYVVFIITHLFYKLLIQMLLEMQLSAVLSAQEVFCKHICCNFHGVPEMLYNHIPFTKCFEIKNFQNYKISPTDGHSSSKQ